MKRLKRYLLLIMAFCCMLPSTTAQTTSTQGKEFWLSFMHNGFKDHDLGGWITTQILISAKRDCSCTLSNPLTGWSDSFTVRANNITTVDIPERHGYHNSSDFETICDRGIHIIADDTISVFCTNIAYVSFDASFVLPLESLGDDYIIQSYDQSVSLYANDYVENNETSAFLIVATEDNTEIDITPTCTTLRGQVAGQTFSITLNTGQTYQVRSTRTGNNRDLSGSRVTASDCKKIAVFNGNTVTCVPTNQGNGYDHVFEQAMPLRSWGKQFVVTTSLNRNRDFIKITSSADNNPVTRDGMPLITLQAGQSHIFPINESEGSSFLQAEYPCAVYLFNSSSYDQNPGVGGLGDPSMVWIAPVEQRIKDVTFSTFDNSSINITNHSVNIIIRAEDIDKVYFDNNLISPLLFRSVNGNSEFYYTRKNIDHGVHHISCENGFNAHVYGFGNAKGYAYLVGSNAIDLSTNLIINSENVQANGTYPYCSNQPMTFNAEVNYLDYELLWDFGDGTTSTQNPVTHTYDEARIYNASLFITTNEGGCTGTASNTTNFTIDATQQYITYSDEVCEGELYSGNGFNNVHIVNDTILARLQDNPIHSECKDSVLVYITAHPKYHVPISDSRCWQEGGGIYDSYGFSFAYNDSGVYEQTLELQSISGCDSIVTLTLTVADRITYDFDHFECSGSYVWDGRTYTQSGDYDWAYTTATGCDSIATLHLTMGSIKHAEFDTIICGTFVWDEIEYNQTGDYEHVYTSYDGCDSIVTCHLNVSGNIEGATESISTCDSYEWNGENYTTTGLYTHVFPSQMGCDSTVYLNLQLDYTPDPTPIYPIDTSNLSPHWVITATEFQINTYEFQLWDNNLQCRWDTVIWDFDRELGWAIEPYGAQSKKCRIYVTNYEEDTVWLRARIFNRCNPDQGVTQNYWLVSSFYGVDDHCDQPEISVTPNPNRGQMTLMFGDLEGPVTVTVYDMQGKAIDRIELKVTPQSRHSYTLKGCNCGIYLFVFNQNGHIVTHKVCITN